MKDFLSKIATLFLAVLVLISSSFITIDTHYCSGKKIDSSFFGKARLCEMDMVSCKNEVKSTTILKSNCCYDTRVTKLAKVFEKNDTVRVNLGQIDFTPILHLTPVYSLFVETEIDNNYVKDYSSPLVTRDILILVQCFRI